MLFLSSILGGHHDVSDHGIFSCIKVRQIGSKLSIVMSPDLWGEHNDSSLKYWGYVYNITRSHER